MSQSTSIYANPSPLGLAAVGVSAIALSAVGTGLLPTEAAPTFVPMLFVFGGLAQLIVAILEFRTGNTFGMLAFGLFATFFLWYSLLQWTAAGSLLPAPVPAGIGTVLALWGLVSAYLLAATFCLPRAFSALFLSITLNFFLQAAGQFGVGTTVVGNWFGLLSGFGALYLSAAMTTESTFGRQILPLGPPLLRIQLRAEPVSPAPTRLMAAALAED